MPRKKSDSDSVLESPIRIRLTAADRATFTARAKEAGMTQSEFFRRCVLSNRTKVVARLPASADRKRVLFIVNKAGNNLNQIAHVANSAQLAGKLSESTFVELLDELELIQQLLKAHLYRVD